MDVLKTLFHTPFTHKTSRNVVCLLICGTFVVVLCFMTVYPVSISSHLLQAVRWNANNHNISRGITRIATTRNLIANSNAPDAQLKNYVISLPRRTDRRKEMNNLGQILSLNWTYIDAVDTQDESVMPIMDHVRALRQEADHYWNDGEPTSDSEEAEFRWPADVDTSTNPLEPAGSDLWSLASNGILVNISNVDPTPLTCSEEFATIHPYSPDLPEHKILTASKIACWISHVNVMRLVANTTGGKMAVVLEDDVDMEQDIRERLASIWGRLPVGWDIVFLGHCWSNETFYPELPSPLNDTNRTVTQYPTSLHPSYAPKCTHGYVLSPQGAQRILLHLRYIPFAYSRAIDQALAWLIKVGRIRSYSVVPSVVVQRKIGDSDILKGVGSEWREGLVSGVFGTRNAL